MEYQIVEDHAPSNPYRIIYRVLEFYGQNNRNNQFTKGRFNSRHEAQDWIDMKQRKTEENYKSRKGYLHPELQPDIYGENLLSYP